MKRIDVQHHIFPLEYVSKLKEMGITESYGQPIPNWTPDKSLAFMKKMGIATARVPIGSIVRHTYPKLIFFITASPPYQNLLKNGIICLLTRKQLLLTRANLKWGNKNMEYFLTLLGFLITGLFMIWRYKLKLFNSKKHGWIVLGVVFFLIILWDSVAVYRGYWSFHPPHIFEYRLGVLPLEEYFLAFIVPWWIVVFYKTMEKKLN